MTRQTESYGEKVDTLKMFLKESLSVTDIAKAQNVTTSRVCQKLHSAVRVLVNTQRRLGVICPGVERRQRLKDIKEDKTFWIESIKVFYDLNN